MGREKRRRYITDQPAAHLPTLTPNRHAENKNVYSHPAHTTHTFTNKFAMDDGDAAGVSAVRSGAMNAAAAVACKIASQLFHSFKMCSEQNENRFTEIKKFFAQSSTVWKYFAQLLIELRTRIFATQITYYYLAEFSTGASFDERERSARMLCIEYYNEWWTQRRTANRHAYAYACTHTLRIWTHYGRFEIRTTNSNASVWLKMTIGLFAVLRCCWLNSSPFGNSHHNCYDIDISYRFMSVVSRRTSSPSFSRSPPLFLLLSIPLPPLSVIRSINWWTD